PEPVRRYAHEAPAELERIISQLLEKEPRDRFPNALMVARRLEAMERALSLREEKELSGEDEELSGEEAASQIAADQEDPQLGETPPPLPTPADQAGFSLDSPTPPAAARSLNMTRDADAPLDEPSPTRIDDTPPPPLALPDREKKDETEDAPLSSSSGLLKRETRFTTVEDERREAELRRPVEHPLVAAPTWLLIACLVATAWVAYWLMQPPSASALLSRIAAAEEDDRALLASADDVDNFLQYYPDHPRAAEIKAYQRRIKMLQLDRTARARARQLQRQYPESPIAGEYLAAIQLSEIDPDRAVVRLQALENLYGTAVQEDIRVFVQAARGQLPRIREKVRQRAASQRAWVDKQLSQAQKLATSDPDQARTIYQSIIELYRERPWAADIVAHAEERLALLNRTAPPRAP
ncbi:MAG: hypothetical protein GTO03_13725, partial [Planctomycetales bacterium]|nr:hypothetical protein [Planctomycetales bacterium]